MRVTRSNLQAHITQRMIEINEKGHKKDFPRVQELRLIEKIFGL